MRASWLRRRRLALEVSVVGGFVLLGWDVVELAVQAAVVELMRVIVSKAAFRRRRYRAGRGSRRRCSAGRFGPCGRRRRVVVEGGAELDGGDEEAAGFADGFEVAVHLDGSCAVAVAEHAAVPQPQVPRLARGCLRQADPPSGRDRLKAVAAKQVHIQLSPIGHASSATRCRCHTAQLEREDRRQGDRSRLSDIAQTAFALIVPTRRERWLGAARVKISVSFHFGRLRRGRHSGSGDPNLTNSA
jgi:hypothetical protein